MAVGRHAKAQPLAAWAHGCSKQMAPPSAPNIGSADGGPQVYAMLRPSRSTVWAHGRWTWRRVENRTCAPPLGPQHWECRRWAAGLRHAKAQPLGGVGTWPLDMATSREPGPAPPPSAPNIGSADGGPQVYAMLRPSRSAVWAHGCWNDGDEREPRPSPPPRPPRLGVPTVGQGYASRSSWTSSTPAACNARSSARAGGSEVPTRPSEIARCEAGGSSESSRGSWSHPRAGRRYWQQHETTSHALPSSANGSLVHPHKQTLRGWRECREVS